MGKCNAFLFPFYFLLTTCYCITCNVIHQVWAFSFSLAATKEIPKLVYFPPATKMFQFAGLPSQCLWSARMQTFSKGFSDIIEVGFPIRKSPSIALFDSSSRLIAVLHVLHRHQDPRHPPCTLSIFLLSFSFQTNAKHLFVDETYMSLWTRTHQMNALHSFVY